MTKEKIKAASKTKAVSNKVSILDLVDYNKPIKYELKHPVSGAGLGVTFDLVSIESDKSNEVFRSHLLQPNIEKKMTGEGRLTVGMQVARERIAASIIDWDFNGNILEDGDEAEPKPTLENKLKLLSKDWIYKQLDAQVGSLSNFTKS